MGRVWNVAVLKKIGGKKSWRPFYSRVGPVCRLSMVQFEKLAYFEVYNWHRRDGIFWALRKNREKGSRKKVEKKLRAENVLQKRQERETRRALFWKIDCKTGIRRRKREEEALFLFTSGINFNGPTFFSLSPALFPPGVENPTRQF